MKFIPGHKPGGEKHEHVKKIPIEVYFRKNVVTAGQVTRL